MKKQAILCLAAQMRACKQNKKVQSKILATVDIHTLLLKREIENLIKIEIL